MPGWLSELGRAQSRESLKSLFALWVCCYGHDAHASAYCCVAGEYNSRICDDWASLIPAYSGVRCFLFFVEVPC